jgi:hypothetical protein
MICIADTCKQCRDAAGHDECLQEQQMVWLLDWQQCCSMQRRQRYPERSGRGLYRCPCCSWAAVMCCCRSSCSAHITCHSHSVHVSQRWTDVWITQCLAHCCWDTFACVCCTAAHAACRIHAALCCTVAFGVVVNCWRPKPKPGVCRNLCS